MLINPVSSCGTSQLRIKDKKNHKTIECIKDKSIKNEEQESENRQA